MGGSALDFRLCRFYGIKNPPAFPKPCVLRGVLGGFLASKTFKLSIFASFYISIFISLSIHADFSAWALFFLLTLIKL